MATEIVKSFNSILESFLLQITPIIGTTYHHYFTKVIKVNALLPIQHASQYFGPYREKILKRDETYFSDETNYIDELNRLPIESDAILSEILRLKDIYYKLDVDSRENVWSILQALVQLTTEYCEIKGIKF
jgi:hypothetical protein